MATHSSRARFLAARERGPGPGPSLFDVVAEDDPPMSAEERRYVAIRCPCQAWPSVRAYFAHREAGACPWAAPENAGARVHWLLCGRRPTEAELERKALARERLEAVRSNPEYQEHARLKREAARQLRERMKARRK